MSTPTVLPPFDPLDPAGIDDLLTADEKAVRASVRHLCNERIDPYVAEWFERGEIDDLRGLAKELGSLGLLGMHLDGLRLRGDERHRVRPRVPGARGQRLRHPVARLGPGIAGHVRDLALGQRGAEAASGCRAWRPARRSAASVSPSPTLAPTPAACVPARAATAATGSSTAARCGSPTASVADVAVVWAQTEEGIRGFVVPTDTPGFSAPEIKHKLSLRASVTSELVLDGVRLPDSAVLPEVRGLKGPLSCLNEARYGIVWGAMGAARSSLHAALTYANERIQFGKPIAGFQLTQQKLADMNLEYTKGVLLALHLGRRKDAGTLRPEQVSLGKLNNVREALEICRTARTILGANGISLEYPVIRHMNNLESVLTYEGTVEMHTLVVGQAMTGQAAFR